MLPVHPGRNQVAGLLGRFVLPFFGPYNASKHALEALADNYRVELSGFGVDSVIATPRRQRLFRTVVDGMGMGASIEAINKAYHEPTTNIYSAFGMEGKLEVLA